MFGLIFSFIFNIVSLFGFTRFIMPARAILDRTILPEYWIRLLVFAVFFHSVMFSTYPNRTRFVDSASDGFSFIVIS